MADTTAPVPADGPVLCLCGNPDNCSCPPVERTVRLVIENAAPLGPARTITLDGHRYTVLRYEAPDLGMTETYELRQRPTALAGDPGDLPARMAEAMRVALVTWSEGTQNEHLANAALSVRDELVAHLAARVGDAERRAEHAESEHQVTQDRLDRARALVEGQQKTIREEITARGQVEAERDALNACIRATCSAARIAREVGDHRKVVLLSDVERLLTVPELPPLSPPDGGQ